MLNCFGCDELCRLLADGEAGRQQALPFFDELGQALSAEDYDGLPDVISDAAERVKGVCRAMVALLDPTDCSEESIRAVTNLRFYKGKESFESLFKAMLAEGFYAGLADELVKTAGAMKTGMPRVEAFCEKVRGDSVTPEESHVG